jgi:hypothetical protein
MALTPNATINDRIAVLEAIPNSTSANFGK